MKTMALLTALTFQGDPLDEFLAKAEKAERGRKDAVARVTADIADKADESWKRASGSLAFRAGTPGERALLVELKEDRRWARPERTLIRKEEAVVFAPGGRTARVTDLSAGRDFHPFELWRRGLGRWLRERFEIDLAAGPGEDGFPSAVSGPDGTPLEARRSRPSRRRSAYDRAAPEGPDPDAGRLVMSLAPKREGDLPSLRVHVEPESYRVVRIVVESAAREETYTLEDFREGALPDESVFDPDLSGFREERR